MTTTWTIESNPIAQGVQWRLLEGDDVISMHQALTLFCQNAAFRALFSEHLTRSPQKATRWETPPITRATVNRAFECVLVDSPSLARQQDPRPFSNHIQGIDEGVVAFDNLGGDAAMVVPCAQSNQTDHCHLLSFLRTASSDQCDALWQAVGEAALERLSDRPMWISTAGGGVAWLHVRLDSRPKYYAYEPYRNQSYV